MKLSPTLSKLCFLIVAFFAEGASAANENRVASHGPNKQKSREEALVQLCSLASDKDAPIGTGVLLIRAGCKDVKLKPGDKEINIWLENWEKLQSKAAKFSEKTFLAGSQNLGVLENARQYIIARTLSVPAELTGFDLLLDKTHERAWHQDGHSSALINWHFYAMFCMSNNYAEGFSEQIYQKFKANPTEVLTSLNAFINQANASRTDLPTCKDSDEYLRKSKFADAFLDRMTFHDDVNGRFSPGMRAKLEERSAELKSLNQVNATLKEYLKVR